MVMGCEASTPPCGLQEAGAVSPAPLGEWTLSVAPMHTGGRSHCSHFVPWSPAPVRQPRENGMPTLSWAQVGGGRSSPEGHGGRALAPPPQEPWAPPRLASALGARSPGQ